MFPPVKNIDMAKPLSPLASAAAWLVAFGWKAATPQPPIPSNTSAKKSEGAIPNRLNAIAVNATPKVTKWSV